MTRPAEEIRTMRLEQLHETLPAKSPATATVELDQAELANVNTRSDLPY